MQKNLPLFAFLIATAFLPGCPVDSSDDGSDDKPEVKTGKVAFFNESSYTATVHLDAFSGPVLIETLNAGQSKRIDVRTSDNYGVGSTFCIEYSYKVIDNLNLPGGEVWAKGIDPNIQINFVVEENKSYTAQIPQPAELEFSTAFIWITNTSTMQFELRKQGTVYKQAGNGNLPVPPGKIGVYAIPSTAAGTVFSGYSAHTVFNSVDMADFTAKNSYVYYFTYNGSNITHNPDQDHKIVF
jgi:hypothetical protein